MTENLIALRLDAKTRERLEKYAKLIDRPMSWIIRKGLQSYLDELEDIHVAEERLNDPEAKYLTTDELWNELDFEEK
jgi:predicted DNA-binding protein